MQPVIFKMPPFFEFFSDELLETAKEFAQAGVLQAPFDSYAFETIYHEEGATLQPMKIRLGRKNEQSLRVSFFVRGEWIEFDPERMTDDIKIWAAKTFHCCLMALNMREFEQEHVTHSPKLQKARAKRGKPPLSDYVRVYLKPALKRIYEQEGKGHGLPRKPHWRRGHIRTMSNGLKVPVKPCMVNFRGEAIAIKDYEVKGARNSGNLTGGKP